MFREMRRKKQALPAQECVRVLERGTSGVLAVAGEGGYPYAVPLSYVYSEGKLFFHCAPEGHKLDALAQNDKASFCVIDRDTVVPQENTTYFRSVIAFGRARVLAGEAERREALRLLAAKYAMDTQQHCIQAAGGSVCVVALAVEHMTGKEAKELVAAKQGAREE